MPDSAKRFLATRTFDFRMRVPGLSQLVPRRRGQQSIFLPNFGFRNHLLKAKDQMVRGAMPEMNGITARSCWYTAPLSIQHHLEDFPESPKGWERCEQVKVICYLWHWRFIPYWPVCEPSADAGFQEGDLDPFRHAKFLASSFKVGPKQFADLRSFLSVFGLQEGYFVFELLMKMLFGETKIACLGGYWLKRWRKEPIMLLTLDRIFCCLWVEMREQLGGSNKRFAMITGQACEISKDWE